MAATQALEIVSLASAKEHLDVEHNDDDALITRQIGQAVSHVSQVNGVPLTEDRRTYRLLRRGDEYAAIEMPFGWPKPVRSESLSYYSGNMYQNVDADASHNDVFVNDIGTGYWLVRPSMFSRTEWPNWIQASIDVIVAVDPAPERVVAAVYVALSNLYDGQPFDPAIQSLLGA